jgi:uncharacterized RDD family membrane protein YckC
MTAEAYDIICQNCRAEVPSTAGTCPSCGYSLSGAVGPPLASEAAFYGPTIVASEAAVAAARPTLAADPGPAGAVTLPYAGFWIRFAAYLMDAAILTVPSVGLERLGLIGSVAAIAGIWLYFASLESSSSQATPGKRAVGLVVTDDHGRPISLGRATGRYFAKYLSWITLGIGFLMVGWTSRKRGLHDFVADTLVVRR